MNIDRLKLQIKDCEQKLTTNNSTKVVIIAAIDNNDDDKILTYLNPLNVETLFVDLDETNSSNGSPAKGSEKNCNGKKRKADLTCVVCGGEAIGYNFSQISCESCKAFFRRNALHPIEKTKCLKNHHDRNKIVCDIRHTIKQKCQRCRLLKCFQSGMRKDYILTPEEKLSKKQRLEENRQLRSTPIQTSQESTKIENDESITLVNIPSSKPSTLTSSDWTCLNHIQKSYLTASKSTPSASSVVSLELAPDKMSAFMYTIDIQNFSAVQLINFLREIPEFEQLNEHDRLIIIKYNLTLLFCVRLSLTFDSTREICYDSDISDNVSPADEAFAQHCKSLFILCYGYEFSLTIMSVLRNIISITNKDLITTQLIMLILIFSKGISGDDDQEPILDDDRFVFNVQAKYTDLLIRYLMDTSPYEVVVKKIIRLTEQLLKIQTVSRDFQQYLKNNVDITCINPLMKSLLHLT